MNRLRVVLITLIGAITLFGTAPALADVPSLQVAPLSYQGKLKPDTVESGYVDVANPSDEAVQVTSSVQSFRQIDSRGDLAFSPDTQLASAITVGLNNFSLGPRQAVRVVFNIDSSKLPQGGIYAAIFFQTVPAAQSSKNSFVLQSANVGTLLILTNGKVAPYQGSITALKLQFLQLGTGIDGSVAFTNTASLPHSAGFTPGLSSTVAPWGHPQKMASGLVLPGVTRDFSFHTSGSYFGFLPVTVTDSRTGAKATTWVLADTGAYRLALPLALVFLLLLGFAIFLLVKRGRPKTDRRLAPLDGLSRKSAPPDDTTGLVHTGPQPEADPPDLANDSDSAASKTWDPVIKSTDVQETPPEPVDEPRAIKVKVDADVSPSPSRTARISKPKTKDRHKKTS